MNQIEKNTVPSQNQLQSKKYVFFGGDDGKGFRIMFVGNSITIHGYKDDIGWLGDNYGMAASSREKDYVHLVVEKLREEMGKVSYCIASVSSWEADYKNGSKYLERFSEACDFAPDIIVMRFVENCSGENYDKEIFYREYSKLFDYFNPQKKSRVILTTSFWKHPADGEIIRFGKDKNCTTIYLGDLGEDDSMKAIGLFKHSGVANHPGDKGMQAIADRIIKAIKENI